MAGHGRTAGRQTGRQTTAASSGWQATRRQSKGAIGAGAPAVWPPSTSRVPAVRAWTCCIGMRPTTLQKKNVSISQPSGSPQRRRFEVDRHVRACITECIYIYMRRCTMQDASYSILCAACFPRGTSPSSEQEIWCRNLPTTPCFLFACLSWSHLVLAGYLLSARVLTSTEYGAASAEKDKLGSKRRDYIDDAATANDDDDDDDDASPGRRQQASALATARADRGVIRSAEHVPGALLHSAAHHPRQSSAGRREEKRRHDDKTTRRQEAKMRDKKGKMTKKRRKKKQTTKLDRRHDRGSETQCPTPHAWFGRLRLVTASASPRVLLSFR